MTQVLRLSRKANAIGISMSFPDIDKYRAHVNHFDLSEEQKTELLRDLWRIMEGFVDQAFGLDPVQTLLDREAKVARKGGNLIELTASPLQEEFNNCRAPAPILPENKNE